jgi:hypothetical protein
MAAAVDKVEAPTPKDADDTKKLQKDKWKNFFSLSNPNLWIAVGVIALIVILVRATPSESSSQQRRG